jgi:phosphonate transport system substrate-binding protein
LKKNYDEAIDAIGNEEVDIALLGPLAYLEAHSKYGSICILRPRGINGNATYKSVIITKADSNINELHDLRQKRVAFSAFKSTSGNLIPRYLLANSGIHLADLKGYINYDYHDSVVKAVLKGQHDAGGVRDSVANRYIRLGIRVIAESEPIPTGPVVVGRGLSSDRVNHIKKSLLELNPDNTMHQKILKRLDDDLKNGFIEASDNDYADIRANINAVPQTCGRGCHPKIRL